MVPKRKSEEEEEETVPLEESPILPGGFSPRTILITLAVPIVVAWAMVSFLAPGNAQYEADITRLEEDLVAMRVTDDEVAGKVNSIQQSISGLTAQVAGVDAKLAALGDTTGFASKAEVAALSATSVKADADLVKALEALNVRITALETEKEEEEEDATNDDDIRWKFRGAELSNISHTDIGTHIDYDRIRGSGFYDFEIEIRNESDIETILIDTRILLVLIPDDYVVIDERGTYIDSDSSPFLDWDEDFMIRDRDGKDICRRITFTSNRYNFGNLAPGKSITLDLVLELDY